MINLFLNNLKQELQNIIKEMGVEEEIDIFFEVPKDTTFGDYSTNVAMRLAKPLRKAPFMIANEIISKLDKESLIKFGKIYIVGLGISAFIYGILSILRIYVKYKSLVSYILMMPILYLVNKYILKDKF